MKTETKQDCLVCNPDSNNPHALCEQCKEKGYDYRYCVICAVEMIVTQAQYDNAQGMCPGCHYDEYGS